MQSCKLKKYVGKGSWNWVQGTQNGNCPPARPTVSASNKPVVNTNNQEDPQFYDKRDAILSKAFTWIYEAYGSLITDIAERINNCEVNLTSRTGYSLLGERFKNNWAAK